MPDTITHLLFAERILEKLDKNTDRCAFFLGCLGPDPLFYYRLLCRRQNRRSAGTASLMHGLPGYVLVKEAGDYIDNTGAEIDRPVLKSYLEGFISHYMLDSSAHPYIHEVSKGFPNGHKRFEMRIDALLLMDITHKKAKDFDFRSYIAANGSALYKVSEMFAYMAGRCCTDGFSGKRYRASVRYMIKVCSFFRDRLRIYNYPIRLYERLTYKKDYFRYLFYNITENDAPDYMNTSKKLYEKSFPEIFNEAFEAFFKALENNNDERYFQNDFNGLSAV